MKKKDIRNKWRANIFCLLCLIVCFPMALLAQTTTNIAGTITGNNDSLLNGASIMVKGTKTGTVSDENGHYSIQAKKGATLTFSSVGYTPKNIVIADQSTVNVQLTEDNSALNDVIVVSYGTQKARDVTGSISQMNVSEVKDMPTPNIGQRMQGKFAGVQISNNDGTPGAEMSFRVRGAASIKIGRAHV